MADEFSEGIRLKQNSVSAIKLTRDLPSNVDTRPRAISRYTGADKELSGILDSMRKNMDYITGVKGNPKDRAVTNREFTDQQETIKSQILQLERNSTTAAAPDNLIDSTAAGGYSWTDSNTGFTVKSGVFTFTTFNDTEVITFTDAFTTVWSATATSDNTDFGDFTLGGVTTLSASGLTLITQANATVIDVRWIATGFTTV